MAKSAKQRAGTTHSGRARNDESTRPKQTSDSQRGMASKGRDAKAKRPSAPSASTGEPGDARYQQRKESS